MKRIWLIQRTVAGLWDFTVAELNGPRRTHELALARQIAMTLCRRHTRHGLVDIGNAFGGRDHGTVLHAIKTVDNRVSTDRTVKADYEQAERAVLAALAEHEKAIAA
jgi:chromosomal replication initiator protein